MSKRDEPIKIEIAVEKQQTKHSKNTYEFSQLQNKKDKPYDIKSMQGEPVIKTTTNTNLKNGGDQNITS